MHRCYGMQSVHCVVPTDQHIHRTYYSCCVHTEFVTFILSLLFTFERDMNMSAVVIVLLFAFVVRFVNHSIFNNKLTFLLWLRCVIDWFTIVFVVSRHLCEVLCNWCTFSRIFVEFSLETKSRSFHSKNLIHFWSNSTTVRTRCLSIERKNVRLFVLLCYYKIATQLFCDAQ